MEYRLLENGCGVAVTRRPWLLEKNVDFRFTGIAGGLLILQCEDGAIFYRDLTDGTCSVDLSKLCGAVKVTLVIKAEDGARRKWVCEEIFVEHTEDGRAFVCLNDASLSQNVADLRVENDEIRGELAKLNERCQSLEDRLERLMEGYDIM